MLRVWPLGASAAVAAKCTLRNAGLRSAWARAPLRNGRVCAESKQQNPKKSKSGLTMSEGLYSYLLEHTRELELLRRLRAETAETMPSAAGMAVPPEQGQFLYVMAQALAAKRVIEVGVFTGYSSVCLAMALPPDGQLLALDRDPRGLEIARRYWKEAGVLERVEAWEGEAAGSLDRILEAEGPGAFDMAFLDADKQQYAQYYEQLLQAVRPGGVILVDNVLWYGRVADPQECGKQTQALREFNRMLLEDARISLSIVPIGDGIAICRKHDG